MKKTFKIFLAVFLVFLWFYSIFQLYNLSALYKDQIEMGVFFLQHKSPPATDADYIDLSKKALEINTLRIVFFTLFIVVPCFFIGWVFIFFYKRKK